MNDLEFIFEPSAWELTLQGLKVGDSFPAARFLALMEGEDDAETEAALQAFVDKQITLDIRGLPKLPVEGETAARLQMEENLVTQQNWAQFLEENDPLRLYLEELSQLPAAGDPDVLGVELEGGNQSVIPALSNLMLSHVIDLASDYVGKGVLLLDVIQEGSLGLLQGLQYYCGGDITQYCTWWICQYMAMAVIMQARAGGVGQKLRRAMEDYRDVDQRLLTELGRNPTIEEIAEALHMTPQQTMIVAETLETAQLLQRAKATREPEQELQEDSQAVEDTAYFQMRQRIAELLSTLPEQDAQLLTMRYGLEGGLPMKPTQVAAKLGITPEEVTTREAAALAKLREEKLI